ncbi:hypothetical protein [Rhizobium binae]|uniref:hypothetical protein n=1 Tax=Rhizobium binae TaxID=1138190 RepID=UPI003CCFE437
MPDSTPDDAAVVAERVRLAIEMAEIPYRAASCSRSRRVSDVPAGQTTAQAETSRILSNADLALYAARPPAATASSRGRSCRLRRRRSAARQLPAVVSIPAYEKRRILQRRFARSLSMKAYLPPSICWPI